MTDPYRDLRSKVKALPASEPDGPREVLWADAPQQRVGVARDRTGRVEIFIVGVPLEASSAVIRHNLTYDTWHRKNGDPLPANRLVLPPAAHFDSVAAFLCTELIENGAHGDAQKAFHRSEPVIEMAIRSLTLQDEVLIGLYGELLTLRWLLEQAPADRLDEVLGSWHGYRHSTRDFQLGSVGVEVKTTRGATSTHKIHGIRQVERGHGVDGVFETDLFLLSIGIKEVAPIENAPSALSLAELVDLLVELIRAADSAKADDRVESLLIRVRSYGSGGRDGYDHEEMKHRAPFTQRWQTMFARAYDMADEGIKTLRSADLADYTMVDANSVEFVIDLPDKVTGDLNPIQGLNNAVSAFIVRAWGGSS